MTFGTLPVWEWTPNAPSTPTAPPGAPTAPAGVPDLPDYSQIDDLIAQINATNQAAQQQANVGRIPGAAGLEAQSSQNIAGLLNPPDVFGEIDVPSAARAVSSGTVGSPFAGITGLNLSETERIRRQALGQSQLTAAYGRNPAAPIADPQALVQLLQQQGFAGGQSAAQRALQLQLAQMERNTALAIAAMRNAGHYGSVGAPYYGSRVPADYDRPAAASSTYRAEIPDSFGGSGAAWLLPTTGVPDNMYDLTAGQQMDYANAFSNNPYNLMPEVLNPYGAEYNPLDPSLAAYYE